MLTCSVFSSCTMKRWIEALRMPFSGSRAMTTAASK
jgi:hypothetical protein